MAAPLALPPAAQVMERTRQRDAAVLAAALWAISALLVVATLVGAFTTMRSGNGGLSGFRPESVRKFNYMASMVLSAGGMLLFVAEWMVWAVKRNERRQAAQAGGLAMLLLTAMLLGVLEIARRLGAGPADSLYTTVLFSFLGAAAVTIVVGLAAVVVGLLRLGGRQIGGAEPQLARAVSIAVHVPAIAWVMVWGCVYAAAR